MSLIDVRPFVKLLERIATSLEEIEKNNRRIADILDDLANRSEADGVQS